MQVVLKEEGQDGRRKLIFHIDVWAARWVGLSEMLPSEFHTERTEREKNAQWRGGLNWRGKKLHVKWKCTCVCFVTGVCVSKEGSLFKGKSVWRRVISLLWINGDVPLGSLCSAFASLMCYLITKAYGWGMPDCRAELWPADGQLPLCECEPCRAKSTWWVNITSLQSCLDFWHRGDEKFMVQRVYLICRPKQRAVRFYYMTLSCFF